MSYTLSILARRKLAWCLVIAATLCGLGSGCSDSDAEPLAIVLITVDALIPSEMAVFGGSNPTPNIERMAKAGIAFDDMWTVVPTTRPAVATYLTGQLPEQHGVRGDLFTPLAARVPTIASVFRDAGWTTAAFPDSSLLGYDSGLLGGFEVIDDPPLAIGQPLTWTAALKDPAAIATAFGAWNETLDPTQRRFAWIHLSSLRALCERELGLARTDTAGTPSAGVTPAEDEVPTPRRGYREVLAELDSVVGQVMDAAGDRGKRDACVVVVGTFGDSREGAVDLAGPGYSVDPPALRVPLFAVGCSGFSELPRDFALWGPDIARLLATTGRVILPADETSAGAGSSTAGRVRMAWSWALEDQLGWYPLAAARLGDVYRLEGAATRVFRSGAENDAVDEGVARRLQEALAARESPARSEIDLRTIQPGLDSLGLSLDPIPGARRDFGPEAARVEVVRAVWRARYWLFARRMRGAAQHFRLVLGADPDNKAALMGLGQAAFFGGDAAKARISLARAVELYPTDPEVVHWYAHAIWGDGWEQAEGLLKTILPFRPTDGDILYDLACARSRAGELDAAERLLRASIDARYREWDHMAADPDLRNLRESGRFAEIIREYRQ